MLEPSAWDEIITGTFVEILPLDGLEGAAGHAAVDPITSSVSRNVRRGEGYVQV